MTPRQVEYLFRIFTQFMAISQDKRARIAWVRATILLIAISIMNRSLYEKIGNATVIPGELNQYLEGLNFSSYPHDATDKLRYIKFDAMSAILNQQEKIQDEICNSLAGYFNNNNKTEIIKALARVYGDFHEVYAEGIFQTIYKRLEMWRSFIE